MNTFIEFLKKYEPGIHILNSSTEFYLKEDLLSEIENEYNIYIFAGHSYANSRNHGTSYIEMIVPTKKHDVNHKFQLSMQDVMDKNWDNAQLIFLLGCETGGGSLYKGMGISGLQSSFLLAGAKNVVASLWRIDAAQSLNQAGNFFKQYMQTDDFTISLRNMQINAIKKLKQNQYFRHAHPYFWGSFQITKNNY